MLAPTVTKSPLDTDPTLDVIPTYGCVYCGRNTGCYECEGHGIIGKVVGDKTQYELEACRKCLSACTACAFMRNLVLKLSRGRA